MMMGFLLHVCKEKKIWSWNCITSLLQKKREKKNNLALYCSINTRMTVVMKRMDWIDGSFGWAEWTLNTLSYSQNRTSCWTFIVTPKIWLLKIKANVSIDLCNTLILCKFSNWRIYGQLKFYVRVFKLTPVF